jgi:hypothetical protein
VPLAAVLWNGGISFGGVIAFIFADLIVLPILNIYRTYYGLRVSLFLLATFFAAMALAALAVELLFVAGGLIPEERNAKVVEASVTIVRAASSNVATTPGARGRTSYRDRRRTWTVSHPWRVPARERMALPDRIGLILRVALGLPS